jgi:uncharacterized protein (TIGR03083 family)
MDAWPMIKSEREGLVQLLEGLTPEQLNTPSLCEDWTVRKVAGHIIAGSQMSGGSFLAGFIGSGFRFNAMAEKDARKNSEGEPTQVAARLNDLVGATRHPPGSVVAMLGECVVHGEDMRRPLGVKHTYPEDHLTATAEFYKKTGWPLGAKKRISGLTLKADDLDWSTGTGPEVSGPAIALILAMTGRKAGLDDLRGEGLETLSSRF